MHFEVPRNPIRRVTSKKLLEGFVSVLEVSRCMEARDERIEMECWIIPETGRINYK